MKVIIVSPVAYGTRIYGLGDVADLPSTDAQKLIDSGAAEPAQAKAKADPGTKQQADDLEQAAIDAKATAAAQAQG